MDDTMIREVPLETVWVMRQEIMYPKETIGFVKLEDDDKGLHWGLYAGDRLVSVISLFVHKDSLWRKWPFTAVSKICHD